MLSSKNKPANVCTRLQKLRTYKQKLMHLRSQSTHIDFKGNILLSPRWKKLCFYTALSRQRGYVRTFMRCRLHAMSTVKNDDYQINFVEVNGKQVFVNTL